MAVCQGCGRACSTDMCCPNCAQFDRSSFFCSQECFTSNWAEHAKLHAILKQQQSLSQQDQKERKLRGITAASDAVSAIKDLLVQYKGKKVIVPNELIPSDENFKDHQVSPVDRLIGPNGVMGPRLFLVVALLVVFFFFLKINSLISAIPAAVEKKAVQVADALKGGPSAGGAVLVTSNQGKPINSSTDKLAEPSSEVKNLRSEISQLRAELEKLQAAKTQEAPLDDNANASVPVDAIGAVRNEASVEEQLRALRERVGVVRGEKS